MTTINLHGILAKEFGDLISCSLSRPKEVVDAVSVNKPLFRKRLIELAEEGIHYSLIVDGDNIKTIDQWNLKKQPLVIDFVPIICGHGPAILLVAGIASMIGGTVGISALGIAAGTGWLVNVGVMMVGMAIQMMLAPTPETKRTEATISGAKESFMISSAGNLADQGVPLPVGYGRLRTGSYIVQSTIKSYPQKQRAQDALAGQGNIPDDIGLSLKES